MPEIMEIPGKEESGVVLSAEQLTCGIQFLTDFWREKYLQEYIRNGGSKIKFVTGRVGSGKTHFLRLMTAIAQEENYKTIRFLQKMYGCTILKKYMSRFFISVIF